MKDTDYTDNNVEAGFVPAFYIHIPFCRKKCNYCDFVSADYTDKTTDYADKYLKTLVKEFSFHLPSSVYIGGGTPSILSEKQIEFLFENLFNYFRPKKGISFGHNYGSSIIPEITFEINPESVTEEKLKLLKSCGVNRLSFGLQALDNNLLKILGRVHTKEDFLKKFDLARKIGFENINIDLIFGIPEQTLKDWQKTLTEAITLNTEHISVYNLTVEEGTNFYKHCITVDDGLSADMFQFAIEYLKKNGYHHYEISNFSRASKPGFECKHNINYWKNGEYLGFGLGAVSYINGIRIKNTENLADYLNGKFRSDFEELNSEQKMSEDLMLGLRLTDGVEMSAHTKENFSAKINNLKHSGLLKEQNNFLKLTDKGIMFANCVFREFL
ncbi:MAG: coproporphyrinogen III oxidase [Elusimicrobia bacterium HGW-Elusimicrobia-4]|nr:MAG: coproporphyrinogen III oxidase [Elusimicrobia bacterium HGW-Elusimicrobia-4]